MKANLLRMTCNFIGQKTNKCLDDPTSLILSSSFFEHFFFFFFSKFELEVHMYLTYGMTGPEVFEVDEHPRPNTTPEILTKLPTVFKKGGTITAGNASVSST